MTERTVRSVAAILTRRYGLDEADAIGVVSEMLLDRGYHEVEPDHAVLAQDEGRILYAAAAHYEQP